MANTWHSFPWTREQIDLLKKLWLEGWSAKEIGAVLGVSRSSCLGKLSRLGLLRRERPKLPPGPRKPRLSPEERWEKTKQAVVKGKRPLKPRPKHSLPFPAAPPLPPAPPAPPDPPIGSFDILELKHWHCRWPEGDGPWTFCGRPRHGESAYCPEHYQRSIAPSFRKPVGGFVLPGKPAGGRA